MRIYVAKVLSKFVVGKAARSPKCRPRAFFGMKRGDGKEIIRLTSDGKTLFSYKMPIAQLRKGGKLVRLIERDRAPSPTTRAHIDAVRHMFGKYHRETGWDFSQIEWVAEIPARPEWYLMMPKVLA